MDNALLQAPNATELHDTWHVVLRDLMRENPPERDRLWLSDRLLDLQLHVYNSSRWLQSLEGAESGMRRFLDQPN